MILKLNLILSAAACVTLTACSQGQSAVEASRVDNDALFFYNDAVTQGPIVDQVDALSQSANDLVRKSRVNGALVGAAVGCGLTAISGANARNCVAAAAVSGASGALIGDMVGEQRVQKRVELVSEGEVARRLRTATAQVQTIQTSLQAYLAQQEQQLNSLTMQLVRGEIDQQEHDLAMLQIGQDRMNLGDALQLSGREARRAANNLERAARRGQTGLDWHIGAASRLADEVESTRLSFDL